MAEFSEGAGNAETEALEAAVAEDPGGAQFGVLAEAYRRAGRHEDARRVAVAGLALRPDDTAGRLALGLTLLDLGEPAAARYELERAMETVTDPLPSEGIAASEIDDELEAAFADAESVAEEMLDANQIAAQAMIQSELDEPEGFALEEAEAFEPAEESFELGEAPAFATETMARLLTEQGDTQGAEAIRERLGELEPMDAAMVPGDASLSRQVEEAPALAIADEPYAMGAIDTNDAASERGRILATLETWLANLQRNRA